jgi:hypothetical protein
MDPALIVIGISAVIFGILPIALRSSAVYIFLTLAAGELLSRLTAQDATQFVRSFPAPNSMPTYSIVQISLLLVVPILILIAYKNSMKPSQLFFHLLPALASVLVCVMLVTAKLPYETKDVVENSGIFKVIEPFFSVAVAAGLLSSAFYLMAIKPKHDKHKKHRHK